MPTTILSATGTGASCRATPPTAFKTAEVGLCRQQHRPASDCTVCAPPSPALPTILAASLQLLYISQPHLKHAPCPSKQGLLPTLWKDL